MIEVFRIDDVMMQAHEFDAVNWCCDISFGCIYANKLRTLYPDKELQLAFKKNPFILDKHFEIHGKTRIELTNISFWNSTLPSENEKGESVKKNVVIGTTHVFILNSSIDFEDLYYKLDYGDAYWMWIKKQKVPFQW